MWFFFVTLIKWPVAGRNIKKKPRPRSFYYTENEYDCVVPGRSRYVLYEVFFFTEQKE